MMHTVVIINAMISVLFIPPPVEEKCFESLSCPTMEIPLTPLEFARRARRLDGTREAVVDGEQRLSYEQFFDSVRPMVGGAAVLTGLPKTATGKTLGDSQTVDAHGRPTLSPWERAG
jgi:hypothetical protein